MVDRLAAAGAANADGVRFLVSAHASHEELFLFRRLAEELIGNVHPAVSVSWRVSAKDQPEGTKFKVPEVDAPNVHGARMLGLVGGGLESPQGRPDITELRTAVEAGRVAALYVYDPGPEGSLGETDWIVAARKAGTLPLLIVQGVLLTPLARAADFVLPGASFVEKEASYSNEQGRLQAASRAIPLPGDATDDWQILVNLADALGLRFGYASSADVRRDIAARFADQPGFAGIAELQFGTVVSAQHWLQASNPSERWKWDVMFQDLPPVKGAVDPSSLPVAPGMIPLREVK
jgi:predicted molibdopterin-dependent oxidoreductase YjgC